MSPEQQRTRFREIAVEAAAIYPSETDFTYRHDQVPYTLQRLQIALRICAGHLVEHPNSVALRALESMHADAEDLKIRDPKEFGASILRGNEYAQRKGSA